MGGTLRRRRIGHSLRAALAVSHWFTPKWSLRRQPEKHERALTIDDVARWLLGPGRAISRPAELLHELSWRLVAAGIPLARTTLHIARLHPQFLGVFCRWQRATGETYEAAIAHAIRETDAYRLSPMPLVFSLPDCNDYRSAWTGRCC